MTDDSGVTDNTGVTVDSGTTGAGDLSNLPPLATIYAYVTSGCNCACRHCWIVPDVRSAGSKPRHDLSIDDLRAAVEEALPLGLAAIKWTGGEPTVNPNFPDLLRVQAEHGLEGRLETNGMLVDADLARLLRESGVTDVAVSIDGATAETHDAIRGVRGAFERARRGLQHVAEAGIWSQAIFSLMRSNVGELDRFLDLAETLGVRSVKLNVVQPTLRGEEMHAAQETLTIAEYLEIARRLDDLPADSHSFRIFMDVPMAFRSIGDLMSGGIYDACGIKNIIGLLPDGSYALCGIGERMPDLCFGQAGRGELATIWREHPVILALREQLPRGLQGICSRCAMSAACLGGCIAQNYYRTHDLMAPHWFCVDAERDGRFPTTRIIAQKQESGR